MRIHSLFSLVFILLFSPAMGQTEILIDDFEDEVVASYEDFHSVSRERVYTHFNKSSYLPGDAIWFKSYVFNPQNQRPSIITKNLWVALYGPSGELIEQKVLSVFRGGASSVFALAQDCEPGVYTFKAHTNWMKNFGDEFEELSYIHVLGGVETSLPDNDIDLQLLPESGTLLAGITNKLGIKSLDKDGRGVPLFGRIVNGEGNTIQSFELNRLGMGSISLNLGVEDKLRCEMVLPSGQKVLYPLPDIQEQGIVAQVSQLRNRLFINIASNSSTITEPTHFYAMIHSQGDVKRSTLVSLDVENPSQLIEFDASGFRGGVNCLTLFDAEFRPVAERLFFVDSEESQGNIDFQVASAPDTVTLTLSASKVGNPIEASLSLSVLPEGTRSSLFKNSLFAQVQLSGLKGYVENPAHYFDRENAQRLMDLDVLMLTQGWRRYEWDRILEGTPLELAFENEKGFSIQGKVDRWTSQLDGKARVSYLVLNTGEVGFVAPDSEGRFTVSDLELYDSTLVYLSVADEKGRGWDRKITAEPSEIPVHDVGVVKPRYSFLASQVNLSAPDMSIYPADITFEEIRFVGKRILPPEASDLFMAYGGKSFTVTQENAEKYSSVNDILR